MYRRPFRKGLSRQCKEYETLYINKQMSHREEGRILYRQLTGSSTNRTSVYTLCWIDRGLTVEVQRGLDQKEVSRVYGVPTREGDWSLRTRRRSSGRTQLPCRVRTDSAHGLWSSREVGAVVSPTPKDTSGGRCQRGDRWGRGHRRTKGVK